MSQPGETVTYSLEAVLTRIESKIDSLEKRVDDRFDSFEKRVNERFDKVDERFDKVDERFDKVDERLTKLEVGQAEIKSEVSGLQKRTDDLNGRLNIMTVGFLSVIGVFATAIVGILSKLVFFSNSL
jgi:archaellum component FlaC